MYIEALEVLMLRLATRAAVAAILLVGCTAATTPSPTPTPTQTPMPNPTPVTAHLHIVIDNIKFDAQGNDTATATSPDLGVGTHRGLLTGSRRRNSPRPFRRRKLPEGGSGLCPAMHTSDH